MCVPCALDCQPLTTHALVPYEEDKHDEPSKICKQVTIFACQNSTSVHSYGRPSTSTLLLSTHARVSRARPFCPARPPLTPPHCDHLPSSTHPLPYAVPSSPRHSPPPHPMHHSAFAEPCAHVPLVTPHRHRTCDSQLLFTPNPLQPSIFRLRMLSYPRPNSPAPFPVQCTVLLLLLHLPNMT